ncbi:YceI family protein [Emticicia sp. SJ17W-69]|uniref:YceI family protein n=1 Tax=Emticicia sp. SJ17W-69 TaxID=3421657 RepID=UPI003EBA81F6
MKNIVKILFLSFLISNSTMAQNFICQSGETSFFSETPLENIAALNKTVTSVLNISTNEIAVKMTMTEFKFKNHLMEEHFNENYMESSKFPNGVFKGKINEAIDWKKNGVYDVTAKGTLTMHGVPKERILKGKITIEGDKLTLVSDFNVPLVDHKIDVPTLVVAKIAENISVKNKFVFTPLKK